MICRACKAEHNPLWTCGRARRVREAVSNTASLSNTVEVGRPTSPAGKFDKTAYQRDYMRKRRAAEKAAA